MNRQEQICWVVDLGSIRYGPAWDLQKRLVASRKQGLIPDVLLFCEHPHVITLGRNGKSEHLRAGSQLLSERGVEFELSDRGGDITYHGPGQIVGYPIIDLSQHRRDVRWYVNQLEELMIGASLDFGVEARRVEGRHGIWVDTPSGEEKLAALGVHLSRWVTSHGFAYNVSTDLDYFDLIVPCGIQGKKATSLERVLGRSVEKASIRARLVEHFANIFECETQPVSFSALEDLLVSHAVTGTADLVAVGSAEGRPQ